MTSIYAQVVIAQLSLFHFDNAKNAKVQPSRGLEDHVKMQGHLPEGDGNMTEF